MDNGTILLFILLTAAIFWWFKLGFEEDRSAVREFERKKKEQLLRAERVRQLINKR